MTGASDNQCGFVFCSARWPPTREHSDVDIAVWPAEPLAPRVKLRWLAELEPLLRRDVSLVIVSASLNPVLGFEIVRDGRLVFEETPGLWQHHRAQLWHAYDDSLPFRRAARQRLHEFAEKIRHGA